MKIYKATIGTYYKWGEPRQNDWEDVGIFSSPEKAYTAADKRLREQYDYDEKSDTWKGSFADEAWIEIWEIQVDGDPEKNENVLGMMEKDSDGIWYNAEKRMEEEMINNKKED